MKIVTEKISGVSTTNNQTGKPIEVRGVKKAIILTISGKQVFAPLEAVEKGANEVVYKLHEKGDTFVANRDSTRVHEDGENKGNPLYLKGDVVTRNAESIEFVAANVQEVFSQAAKEKMEFAAKLGLSVKI